MSPILALEFVEGTLAMSRVLYGMRLNILNARMRNFETNPELCVMVGNAWLVMQKKSRRRVDQTWPQLDPTSALLVALFISAA